LCQSEPFTNRVTANSAGVAYPAITEIKLKAFEIGVPPLPEQAAITRFLNASSAKIGDAITGARREIELLHEYRTRLTADVVAGKLDVRSAAVELSASERVAEDERGDAVSGETGFCMEEHKAREESR